MLVLRRLLKEPGFTCVALITLAIGIGANTAIFSVVEGILLKPLPFLEPERLVAVWHSSAKLNLPKFEASPGTYFTYREEGRAFQDIALWNNGSVSVTRLAEPEQVQTLWVTDGALPILGVKPVLGHVFTAKDDTDGSPRTAMVAWSYWQKRFGGSPSAVGKQIVVDGNQHQIIGVLPRNFRFMNVKADLLLPLRLNRSKVVLGDFSYKAVAKLKPGVTIAQANADIARMIPMSLTRFPPPPGFNTQMFEDAKLGPNVRPLKADTVGDIGDVLWILMATIGAVLLIACANVANLLLVRAERRQHELAIRAALGAGWGRIARELLAESIALGIAGGILGLGVAFAALRLLVYISPASLPRLDEVSIDPAALAFTLAISLAAGLLFGLLPVFRYAGSRIGTGLRESGRALSHSRERLRARNVLVVAQVALAVVLLVGSGLMIRTFQALRRVDPGFTKPEEVLTMRVSIPEAEVKDPARVIRMQNDIVEKMSRIPGVVAEGLTTSVTMDGHNSGDILYAQDHPIAEGSIPPVRRFKFIGPGYFHTVGARLLAGRDMTWADIYGYRNTVLVSENLAREYWQSPSAAIGKRLREGPKDEWSEVVGVVNDERDDGVQEKAPKVVYWPMAMKNFWGDKTFVRRTMAFVIRSPRAESSAFLNEASQVVWSVSASSPVADVKTLQAIYMSSMAKTSFTLVMLGIAGGMALILGLVGIYGVIAYSVSQRRREIGIRMALGARQKSVSGMFVKQGAVLAVVGVACGSIAAAALTRLMASLLFGTSAFDLPTYFLVAFGLVAAVLLASYVPARKAATVDPMETLRAE
jgi:putative ABC transport system permease protein